MKALLALKALLIMIGIGLAFTIYLGHDTPPRDYSDLVVVRRNVPPDQNALTYLKAASERLVWPDDEAVQRSLRHFGRSSPANPIWVAEIVSNNTETLRLLRQAASCPDLQPIFVEHATPDNIADQLLGVDLNHMRLLQHAARHEHLLGNHAAAVAHATALMLIGAHIHNGAPLLLDSLIGLALMQAGCEASDDLIQDPATPCRSLETMAEAIDSMPPLAEGSINAMKHDFQQRALPWACSRWRGVGEKDQE